MKVIICGSGSFNDWKKTLSTLDYWHSRLSFTALIIGSNGPLIELTRRWGDLRGVPVADEASQAGAVTCAAEAIRLNRRILETHRPGALVDFAGGDETKDMLFQARMAKLKCIEVG